MADRFIALIAAESAFSSGLWCCSAIPAAAHIKISCK